MSLSLINGIRNFIMKYCSGGQTLIEVLVALTLIILFMSGITAIELYAIRNSIFSENKSIATNLANQQIERARVIRDSGGLSSLTTNCFSSCYINSGLTPVPVTPTGIYGQSLQISGSNPADCPLPVATITPTPVAYKITAKVEWSKGAVGVTPAPEVDISSCLTNWN